MSPTKELVKFLIEWGKKNDYTFYVPEGDDDIKLLHVDISAKRIYVNSVNMDNVISPN